MRGAFGRVSFINQRDVNPENSLAEHIGERHRTMRVAVHEHGFVLALEEMKHHHRIDISRRISASDMERKNDGSLLQYAMRDGTPVEHLWEVVDHRMYDERANLSWA